MPVLEAPWWLSAPPDHLPADLPEESRAAVPVVPDCPAELRTPVALLEPCDCACCTEAPAADAVADAGELAPVRWAIPGVWDDEPTAATPAEPGVLVAELTALLERLVAVDVRLLSAEQGRVEAEALLRAGQRLRVGLLPRLARIAQQRPYDRLGFRSVGAWLAGMGPDADRADLTLAQRLADLPELATALREGRVTLRAARQVAAAARKVRPHVDQPDGRIDGQPGEPVIDAVLANVVDLVCQDRCGLDPADPARAGLLAALEQQSTAIAHGGGSQHTRVLAALVLLAAELTPVALARGIEEIVLQLVPTLLEERDRSVRARRGVAVRPNPDGSWTLEGLLTGECGERLLTALAAEARRDPSNPLDTALRERARHDAPLPAPAEPGELPALGSISPDLELMPRSRSARLHDALDRLLTRYLGAGLGGRHDKVPVQLTVTVAAGTVDGAPGAPPGRGGSGRPLARSLLRRLWCDANLTAVLMGRGWIPLGITHLGRTLTAKERTALRVQHGNRCAGDGCCPSTPDPLIPLVPHHVLSHASTGRTTLTETLPLCPTAHHDLHTGHRTLRLRDGRLLTEDGYLDRQDHHRC